MLSDNKNQIRDNEIIEKGTKILIKELGYSGYLRFIRMYEHGEGDYLRVKEDLFKGMTLEELSDKAMEHWETVKCNFEGKEIID